MTKTEANAVRRTLESRQSELGKGTSNREGLEIASSPDELDRIQEAMERDYRMGNLERSSNLLREVRGALRRIDTDAFGICASCHEDINQKRLAAIPWASLCIVCQEAADREQQLARSEIGTEIVMAA